MINGSFVFGMDDDDASVFARAVEWAIEQGIETATFHVLTRAYHAPVPSLRTCRVRVRDVEGVGPQR